MAPSSCTSTTHTFAPTPDAFAPTGGPFAPTGDSLGSPVLSYTDGETDSSGLTSTSVNVSYTHGRDKEEYTLSRADVLADLSSLQQQWDRAGASEGWDNFVCGRPPVAFRSECGFYAGIVDSFFLDPEQRPSKEAILSCFEPRDWAAQKKEFIDLGYSVDAEKGPPHDMYACLDKNGALTHFSTESAPGAFKVSLTYYIVRRDDDRGYAFHALLPRLLTRTCFFGSPKFVYMHIQRKHSSPMCGEYSTLRVAMELVTLPLCLRDFLRHKSDVGRKMVTDRTVDAHAFECESALYVATTQDSIRLVSKASRKKKLSTSEVTPGNAVLRLAPFMAEQANRDLLQETMQYAFADNPACPGPWVVPRDELEAYSLCLFVATVLMELLAGSSEEAAQAAAKEQARRREMHDAFEEAERARQRVAELRRRHHAEQAREARANAPEKPYTPRGQQPRSSKKKGVRGRGDAASAMVSEVHRTQRPIRARRFDTKQELEHAEAVERKAAARLAAARKAEADASKEEAARTHVVSGKATVADFVAHAMS